MEEDHRSQPSQCQHWVYEDFNNRIETLKQDEFKRLSGITYLDHAGATLYSEHQVQAYLQDLQTGVYGNPHSANNSSQLTTDLIDQIRYRILDYFHTNSNEYSVIFTSGCTASLRLVAESFVFSDTHCGDTGLRNDKDNLQTPRGAFLYLEDNHTSVIGMRELLATRGATVQCVSHDQLSFVTSNVEKAITDALATTGCHGNVLFAYPAQSNFSGQRYPLKWINTIKQKADGKYYVLLDAASFVTTCDLDLSRFGADFVTLSFYKMFGFPTGLGALLVKNTCSSALHKTYFGGGTVQVSLATQRFHVNKKALSDKFEDGTLPFLEIIALKHGFNALQRITGGLPTATQYAFHLAKYTYLCLTKLHHDNEAHVAKVYCDTAFVSMETQGPIVTFNLLEDDGSYIGFARVDKLAASCNIDLRVGCFCNMGACQRHLHLSSDKVRDNFKAGHVCGDDLDLIEGQPTGAVRVSYGYMSTLRDVCIFLQFVVDCFLQAKEKPNFLQQDGPWSIAAVLQQQEVKVNRSTVQEVTRSTKKVISNQPQVDEVNYSPQDVGGDKMSEEAPSTSVMSSGVSVCKSCDLQDHPHKSDEAIKRNLDFGINSTESQSKNSPKREDEDCFAEKGEAPDCCVAICDDTLTEEDDKCESKHCADTGQEERGATVATPGSLSSHGPKLPHDRLVLTDIMLYPVKSCAPFKVSSWEIGGQGLLFDRQWMVITESGVCLSQKREPNMCRISPTIDIKNQTLTLHCKGMSPLQLPIQPPEGKESEAKVCHSKVCMDRVVVHNCGDEASLWLEGALGRSALRLVQHMNTTHPRTSQGKGSGGSLSLANGSQYLLLNRSSVEALHSHMADQTDSLSHPNIGVDNLIDRFRGNLVIGREGGEAFMEDNWKQLKIGAHTFKVEGGCPRCQMICVDQNTGQRGKEPLLTLTRLKHRKVEFGILLQHLEKSSHQMTISCGEDVTIMQ